MGLAARRGGDHMNRRKEKAKTSVMPKGMAPQPKAMKMAMKAQMMPSTPPSKAEKGTSKPSASRKMEMPPKPQPVPQNMKRKKGMM